MQKLYIAFILLFVATLGFQSCTSGTKALEKGQYDAAVLKAVNRLRQKPGQKKARETLKEGYPLAHNWHLDNINRARMSSNIYKWERVVNEYAALNRLHNEIKRCPDCMKVVSPTNYSHEYDQAKITAAKVRYEEGNKHLDRGRNGNRVEARKAYDDFNVCNQLSPQYQDVIAKLDEAKYYATLKVLVEKIPMHSRLFKLSNEFFENKVNEYVHSMSGNPFVRFYTPEEAKNTGMTQPDQIIRMEFDDFVVGSVSRDRKSEEIRRDSVVLGQHQVIEERISYDTAGTKIIDRVPVQKDIIGTAKATLKSTTIAIESRGLLDFKIIDAYTNKVLSQEKFPGTYVWSVTWGSFNGDERALNNDQIAITKREAVIPSMFPNPQDMFIEFTRPIFDQMCVKINSFYRNY